MNKSTLLLVKANAQLVISRIDKVLTLSEEEVQKRKEHNLKEGAWFKYPNKPDLVVSYTKANSALRRTSMELTRSLADLRQNR